MYVIIDDQNRVVNIQINAAPHQNAVEVPDDTRVSPGDVYDPATGTFSTPPEEPTPALEISLNAEEVNAGGTVTATVSVKLPDGTVVPVSGTYYVPVMRKADGIQAKLLKVVLKDGTGSVQFSIPESGIYTLDPQKIEPAPEAELPAEVRLVVL